MQGSRRVHQRLGLLGLMLPPLRGAAARGSRTRSRGPTPPPCTPSHTDAHNAHAIEQSLNQPTKQPLTDLDHAAC